jgi:hypothetical protein
MSFLNSVINGLLYSLFLVIEEIENNLLASLPQLLFEHKTGIGFLFLVNNVIFDKPILLQSE